MKLLCLLCRWIELLLLLLLQGQSYFPTIYNLPPISKDRVTVSKLIVPRREREKENFRSEHFLEFRMEGGGDRKVGQLIGAFTDKTGRIEDQGERRGRGVQWHRKLVRGQKAGERPEVAAPSSYRGKVFDLSPRTRRQPTAKWKFYRRIEPADDEISRYYLITSHDGWEIVDGYRCTEKWKARRELTSDRPFHYPSAPPSNNFSQ